MIDLSIIGLSFVILSSEVLDFEMQDKGISVLNNAIKACTEAIENEKGKLIVKEAARAVSSIAKTLIELFL